LRYDVAEGIIRDLVENVTALVQHRTGLVQLQPHRVEVVGQVPQHPLTGVRGSEIHPRERLVELVAVEIPRPVFFIQTLGGDDAAVLMRLRDSSQQISALIGFAYGATPAKQNLGRPE
jgi:hypothetical protein